MLMKLSSLDLAIIVSYFVMVLGVGYFLKGKIKTSSDFLLTDRSLSHWVTGIAFMSANLGSLEIMGHIANGAKYGMRTNHWYWIGAIPAMVFCGLFMVRYYYANGIRSVPEYLRMRYDYRAHLMNAVSFAFVTILMSGINMFAFALLFHTMLGWSFTVSVALSGIIVLLYTFWGGLASSIWNEVLQFFLIVFGFLPLTFIGLREVGGWHGLLARLPEQYAHTWKGMGSAGDPLGVDWWVVVIGLGLTAAPAYWCTDFLLVQRALEAKNLDSARKTPLVAAVPKMLFPAIVTLLGHAGAGRRAGRSEEQLQFGASHAAGQILRQRDAGLGADRAAGQFHVGNGGKYHGVQHCIYLRSLSDLPGQRPPGFALSRGGEMGDGLGNASQLRIGLHRSQLRQSDGLHAVDRGIVDCAVLHCVFHGNVLEESFGLGRFLRDCGRHGGLL